MNMLKGKDLKKLLLEATQAGFDTSAEGCNAEYAGWRAEEEKEELFTATVQELANKYNLDIEE